MNYIQIAYMNIQLFQVYINISKFYDNVNMNYIKYGPV